METVVHLILFFTIYSFIGWCCETVLCSVEARKFINRGFLNGPFCPVYGFGALIIVFLLTPCSNLVPFPGNLLVLFLSGMVATSILEYFTGLLLETLFHAKWWDYSHKKYNLHGRVCLSNSIMFGLMAVLVMEFVHPAAIRLVELLPNQAALVLAAVFLVYFLSDCFATVRTVLRLNHRLAQLQQVLDESREKTELLRTEQQADFQQKIAGLRDRAESRISQLTEARDRLEHDLRPTLRRVMKAFPHMSSTRHPESFQRLRTALGNWTSKKRQK